MVRRAGGKWPLSPKPLTDTRPSGLHITIGHNTAAAFEKLPSIFPSNTGYNRLSYLIVIQVMLACFREIRSQASGGNCNARQTKYLKIKGHVPTEMSPFNKEMLIGQHMPSATGLLNILILMGHFDKMTDTHLMTFAWHTTTS